MLHHAIAKRTSNRIDCTSYRACKSSKKSPSPLEESSLQKRSNLLLSRLIVGGNNTRSFELVVAAASTAAALERLNLRRQPGAVAADSISAAENFRGEITMSTTSFLREWRFARRAKLLFIEMAVFQARPAVCRQLPKSRQTLDYLSLVYLPMLHLLCYYASLSSLSLSNFSGGVISQTSEVRVITKYEIHFFPLHS